MIEILVPIFICAITPISIVLIVMLVKMNEDKQRAQIIIKAIEANNDIDADKLAESLKKPQRTPREVLNLRLLRGCIFSLLGIGLCLCGLFSYTGGREFGEDSVLLPFMMGFASFSIGLSYLIVYFVTRKQIETGNK